MAMATTSSFTLSSFTVPKPHSLLPYSLHSLSSSLHPAPPSLSVAFPAAKRFQVLSSRFVRNVAVSSEVDQEEDDESFGGGRQPRFSADVKLFVGNLPFDCDSAQLAGLFESAGNVEMVEVIYDKVSGRSRGFGFVTMSSVDEAEAAAQQFNGYDFQGRQLRVNAGPPPPKRDEYGSSPRAPRGGGGYESSRGGGFGGGGGGGGGDSSHRLHVGNLSWGVDDLSLRDLFSDHGNVVEAKVIFDRESGRSRGFGFVTFNSSDEVNKAIDSLDGADLDGRQIRVTVAEARPPRRQF